MNFDGDLVVEMKRLGRGSLDHLAEQGDLEQGRDVTQDDPRLAMIARDHHHGPSLSRSEVGLIIPEGRDVDGGQGQDERLAAASAHDQPTFAGRERRSSGSARASLVDRELLIRHRKTEQRGEEREPRLPRLAVPEPRLEEVGVSRRFEDRDHLFPPPSSS